jgi:hypothetical protein
VQAANPVGTYGATVTVVIAPATLGAGPPLDSYTLILRHGHHAIIVPVTIR